VRHESGQAAAWRLRSTVRAACLNSRGLVSSARTERSGMTSTPWAWFQGSDPAEAGPVVLLIRRGFGLAGQPLRRSASRRPQPRDPRCRPLLRQLSVHRRDGRCPCRRQPRGFVIQQRALDSTAQSPRTTPCSPGPTAMQRLSSLAAWQRARSAWCAINGGLNRDQAEPLRCSQRTDRWGSPDPDPEPWAPSVGDPAELPSSRCGWRNGWT